MENDIQEPKKGEHLVCYFEDGSFSIVPETEVVPFSPVLPPYTNYIRGGADGFLNDKAVMLATLYWETGIVPPTFTWVRDEERYTNASVLPLAELPTTSDQFPAINTTAKSPSFKKFTGIKGETFETRTNFIDSTPFLEDSLTISRNELGKRDNQGKKEKITQCGKNKSLSPFTPKNHKISTTKNGSTGAPKSVKPWNNHDRNLPNVLVTPSTTSSHTSFSDMISPLGYV
ncbi:hypothetical protein K7432_007623 [Basidiobolus ranarum]